jgi:hypothetical protein
MRIIKTIYRLLKYRAEWHKQLREIQIRKYQKSETNKLNSEATKLIVFFIPGAEYKTGKEAISGGLISIVSLAEESRKIFSNDLTTEVVCCTYFGDHLLFKLTSFENSTPVFNYRLLTKYFKKASSIILHVPELFVEDFYNYQLVNLRFDFQNIHVNILNQNINLMPKNQTIAKINDIFKQVTITTAHKKYCTSQFQELYNVPLHLLSVWISPEKYKRTDYREKKDLILFSPDNSDLTEKIIQLVNSKLPEFETRIINGLSYEEYKNLIREAKFVITTGEGLDAYFVEIYFSGGIGIAIKNEEFFDEKYLSLNEVLKEEELISNNLWKLISRLNNGEAYAIVNSSTSSLLLEDYSSENYHINLQKFYQGKYSLI